MTKLLIPVEWVGQYSGHYWVLKSLDRTVGIGSVVLVQGKYFNSAGKILKDNENNQVGYDTLEEAQKAVESNFEAQHVYAQANHPREIRNGRI